MTKKNAIFKMTSLAILSALGVVLMGYIQIPYPLAPFLKIEFSDFVVLFTFLLFGFKEALLVALVKTGANLLFFGPVGPYAVGQITALIASLSYVLYFALFRLVIQGKGSGWLWLRLGLTVLCLTLTMTIANYFLLTPIFLGEFSFLDMQNDALASFTGVNSYFLSIVTLYVPFNLLKGGAVVALTASLGRVIAKYQVKEEEDVSETQE